MTINEAIDLTLIIAATLFILMFLIMSFIVIVTTVSQIGWKAMFFNVPLLLLLAGKLALYWLILWIVGYFVKQL